MPSEVVRNESPDGVRELPADAASPANTSHSTDAATRVPSTPPQDATDLDDGFTTGEETRSAANDSESYLFTIDSSTPLSKPSRNRKDKGDKNEQEQQAVLEELRTIHSLPLQWLTDVFADLPVTDQEIDKFLKWFQGYNHRKRRWTIIPDNPSGEEELYKPLARLIRAIIKYFYGDKDSDLLEKGIGRIVVDTHNVQLAHADPGKVTKPDICIKAQGPSFEVPETDGPSYTNVASVVDAKLDKYGNHPQDQVKQVGVYCKEIIRQQPNRQFARAVIVTEHRARLIHFDRSGAHVTPFINYHGEEGRAVFVRLILGICSPSEEVLGFDTSVQWTISPTTGRKVAGTITVTGRKVDLEDTGGRNPEERNKDLKTIESEVTTIYDLKLDEPPTVLEGIRGRGTVAWRATDRSTGEDVIIKDSWRSAERISEVEYLKQAIGISGIGQILCYQDGVARTADYWPDGFAADDFYNRIKLRVVLKCHGRSIWYFKSRLELFEALRASMAGHHELYAQQLIVHRDISVQNVLLGVPNAPEELRGIVIDLDMAIRVGRQASEVSTDPRSGSRMYQSIDLLQGNSDESRKLGLAPPSHGYMDDFESFLHVTTHLMFGFKRPGVPSDNPSAILAGFASPNPATSVSAKQGFIGDPLVAMKHLSAYWDKPCRAFLREFCRAIFDIQYAKSEALNDPYLDEEEKKKQIGALRRKVFPVFQKVIASLDSTIKDLKEAGPNSEELEPYPEEPLCVQTGDDLTAGLEEDELPQLAPSAGSSKARTTSGSSKSKKRGSGDIGDGLEEASRKRNRRTSKNTARGRVSARSKRTSLHQAAEFDNQTM